MRASWVSVREVQVREQRGQVRWVRFQKMVEQVKQ